MAKRLNQLAQEYRKEISDIIANRVKDDGISGLVSVLSVDVSPDLRHARVYVSIFQPDEEKKKACFAALVKNAKTVRYELSRRMTQRTVPELVFVEDTTMDYSDKINRLLKSVEKSDSTEENEKEKQL